MNSVLVRKTGKAERVAVIMLYPMIANFLVAGAALPFVYKPMPIEHLGLVAAMAVLGLTASLLAIMRLSPRRRRHRGPHAVFADHLGDDLWLALLQRIP